MDVYYDDNWIQLGLPFRELSFWTEVLSGTQYQIGITRSGEQDFVVRTPFTPASDQNYMLVFTGVGNPQQFAPNPDGISTRAKILVQPVPVDVVDTANIPLTFVHAVPDAPAVRILRADGQPLYGLTSFGSAFLGSLPYDTLTVELITADGTLVARFWGDLRSQGSDVGLLVLSGFLQPAQNQNGPALALQAVFTDGSVVSFRRLDTTQSPTALVQLIHASPDPQLAIVDVYVNGEKMLEDFGFQGATPLTTLPAGTPLQVGIAPGNSQSIADTLKSFSAILPPGAKLCAVVCGVLDPGRFTPNPDGRPTELTVIAFPAADAAPPAQVRLAVVHAITDYGPISLRTSTVPVTDSIRYADAIPYQTLPATLDTLYNLPRPYVLNLASHGGKAGVLVLTGFANPASNENGPPLEPILVFPDGTVLKLSPILNIAAPAETSGPIARFSPDGRWLWVHLPSSTPSALLELFTLTGHRLGRWQIENSQGRIAVPVPFSVADGVYLCRLMTLAPVRLYSLLLHR